MPVEALPYPPAPAALSANPVYSMLVQFPAVCFVGAFVTDLVYWRTAEFMWETFSIWLLTAGCVLAGLAGIAGLIVLLSSRPARTARLAWPHALASLLAVVLSVVNAFVHSRDGYTAVVPDGLLLSGLVVLVMLVASWMGRMGWTPADRNLHAEVAK